METVEEKKEVTYTQEEVDELLFLERYKNACYEALRAMVAFRSPEHHIINLQLGNPDVWPPPEVKTAATVMKAQEEKV